MESWTGKNVTFAWLYMIQQVRTPLTESTVYLEQHEILGPLC